MQSVMTMTMLTTMFCNHKATCCRSRDIKCCALADGKSDDCPCLVAVGFDELEHKPPVHEGHKVVQEEGQTDVHLLRLFRFLKTRHRINTRLIDDPALKATCHTCAYLLAAQTTLH